MADRKTRYFILVAAVVLVVGLCTGLIAYYRGDLSSSSLLAQAGGQDDLRYVPDAASVVAYADVRTVMNSEFRQRMKKLEHDSRGKNRFQDETGIDIERDVDTVVGCLLSGEDGPTGGFAVLRGRFDVPRIEAAATEHGARVETYNGRQLYVMSDDGPHDGDLMAFGFMEDGALLVGQEPAVKLAIDRADSGASGPSNEDVMRLIDEASAQATVWAVGRPDGLSRSKLPGPVAAQVPQIKWFSATSRVNGGVATTFRAETIDEAAAKNLRDAVTGMAALARMSTGSHQEWQQVLQSLQIGGEGTTVNMSLMLPLAVVDHIANQIGGHKRHFSPRPPPPPPPPPAAPPQAPRL